MPHSDTLTPPPGFEPMSGPPPGWQPMSGPPPGWQEKPDRKADAKDDLQTLTANPNREGTYAMLGPAGESVPIPYSKVLSTGKTGYKLDPKDYSRFMDDFHFAHKKDKAPAGPSPESEFETQDTTEKVKRKGYGLLRAATDLLPTAGTILGGMGAGALGSVTGPGDLAIAAAGAAGGAAIGEGARQAIDSVIWGDTMTPTQRLESIAGEAAGGAVSELGGRVVGNLVGKGAKWYGDTAAKAIQAGFRMLPSEARGEAAGFLERYAKASLMSAGKMAAWREAQNKETASMANNLAESISGFSGTGFKGTKEDLGKLVQDGIGRFQKDFHAKQDALYAAIDSKTANVKPDKQALVDFAQKELAEIDAAEKTGGLAPTGKLKPMLQAITESADKAKAATAAATKAKATSAAAKAAAAKAAADETAAKAAAATAAAGTDKAAATAAAKAANKATANAAATAKAAAKAAADETAAIAAARAAAKAADTKTSYQAMKNTRAGWLALSRSRMEPLSGPEKGLVTKISEITDTAMMDAAQKSGIPGLAHEVRAANLYTKTTHDLFEKQLMRNITRAGKEPSKIARLLDLPSTSVEGAKALMHVLGPAEREAVQTHLIRDAISGATTEGKITFDERKFAEKILKMDDEKGKVIFGPGNWEQVIKPIAINMSHIVGEAGARGGAAELSNPALVMKIITRTAEGASALVGIGGGAATGGAGWMLPIASEMAAIRTFAYTLRNPKAARIFLKGLQHIARAGPYATQATINMAMGAAAANADTDQDTDITGEAEEPQPAPVPLPQARAEAEQRNPASPPVQRKYAQTAHSESGHRIGTDDGVTWFDVETGKQVM